MPIGNLPYQWYGPKNVRPLVAYQGISVNDTNLFKALAPLISKDIGFLEVKFPSEKLPMHTSFHFSDLVQVNLQLMKHFKWNKISLLGHSYGAFAAFNFASFFPEKVDLLITLDMISTSAPPDQVVQTLSRRIERIANQSAERDEESFHIDYCVEALFKVSDQRIDKAFCNFIMERKLKPSRKHPGKFCFVDEKTLENYFNDWLSVEVVLEMITKLKCPYLALDFKNKQWSYNMQKLVFDKGYKALKRSHPKFEHYVISGSSKMLVESSENVSGIISGFIKKHRSGKEI